MASITLEDVPDTFIQKYGTTLRFSAFTVTPRKQSFRERMEDPSNMSYGPFDTMSDALTFLNRDIWK